MTFQTAIPVAKVLEDIHSRSYVLPAIQREFVWTQEKIRLLFDSLLRGYPIGSFLFWKVGPEQARQFTFYDFLQDYHEKDNPYAQPTSIPAGAGVNAILDGQQRLTSLNIGLYGSHAERQTRRWSSNPDAYPRKRLYLNLAGEGLEEDLGMEYDFRFLTEREATPVDGPHKWFRTGKILDLDVQNSGPAIMSELSQRGLAGERPFRILWALYKAIRETLTINYYLEESQDPNKVLDIFVRVNSAGTTLSYSDLLLSMATNQWRERDAREETRSLLRELNGGTRPFEFNKDIVLKTGLILIDAPDIGFKVANFTRDNMALMEKKWEEIRSALIIARELLASFGFSGRTISAQSVLIPISYYVYVRGLTDHYVTSSSNAADREALRSWTVRSLMKRGVWGSGLDTLLTRLCDVIRSEGPTSFPIEGCEKAMNALGKNLRFDEDEIGDLCELEYGRRRTFPALSLLYPGLDLTRDFHEDHIFPRSLFTRTRLRRAGIAEAKIDDYQQRMDALPNLQLLPGLPNVQKQAKLPAEWLQGPHFTSDEMRNRYLAENDLNALPLQVESFLEFWDGRRQLIEGRLRTLLGSTSEQVPPQGAVEPNGPGEGVIA